MEERIIRRWEEFNIEELFYEYEQARFAIKEEKASKLLHKVMEWDIQKEETNA